MNAVVILGTGFEEIEALAVVDILRRAGMTVQSAGIGGTMVTGSHGIAVRADLPIEAVAAPELLVLPGGLLRQLMGTPQPTLFSQGDKRAIELVAMNAVMQLEQAFGYLPRDVSAQKVGYDVESTIPPRLRSGEACLRFIEVKGRAKGAPTVTVSKNEILTGLNKPEEFLLAIVEVDGAHTHTVYLKRPFRNPPDFTATSVNFDIRDLVQNAEVVYEK